MPSALTARSARAYGQPTPQLGPVGPGTCGRGWATFGTLHAGEPLHLEVLGQHVPLPAFPAFPAFPDPEPPQG